MPTPLPSNNTPLPVYHLITRRRFDQMTVLEGQNILVTISGKKRRIRVFYLSWLKQKILRTEGVKIIIKELALNLRMIPSLLAIYRIGLIPFPPSPFSSNRRTSGMAG
jgi:hypothetical protein